MRYYDKKLNMLCFDAKDLTDLFEAPNKKQIWEELLRRGYSLTKLPSSKAEMVEIISSINIIHDKEDIEIFLTLYAFLKFYPIDTKICYLLKTDTDPAAISTLDLLKKSLKEYDLTDFIFMTKEGLIAHQLKGYYGHISLEEFFEYIKKVLLNKYSNDIGATNLLFFLNGDGAVSNDLFREIHERLKTLPIKGTGDILISYNEQGKVDVINTVYPGLRTSRIPHKNFAEEGIRG
jgi:hypothetical protein